MLVRMVAGYHFLQILYKYNYVEYKSFHISYRQL